MKRLFLFIIVFVQAIVGFAESGVDTETPKDIWDGEACTAITPDEAGVYHVTTGAELAWVASESNKASITWNIVLDNNIYLGNHAWTPIGQSKAFNGVFDGQGYTINDLYIKATNAKTYWGLFGFTNTSSGNPAAIIKNVNINGNMNILSGTDKNNVGTLIGYSNNGIPEFTNCHSAVNISMNVAIGANYLGGLIGLMKAGHFNSCSYSGTMTFGADATFNKGWGGLVGSFNSGNPLEGSITNSWFDGTIKSAATTASLYGAYLCGYPSIETGTVTITDNYINGSIEITGETPKYFGNIYGRKNTQTLVVNNNYGVGITGDKKVITVDETQLHNGELCWLLNGDQTQIAFGQTLKDAESVPVVITNDNRVFKTTYSVNDILYTTSFNNATLSFPTDPADIGTKSFVGWTMTPIVGVSDVAPEFVNNTTTATEDLTLYAVFAKKHEATYSDYCTTVAVLATITETGFATFSCDYALDLDELPAGLTAYYATHTKGASTILMKLAEGKVPANTGLFLKGTESTSYNILIAATGITIDENILEPTTGAELPVGTYVYMKEDGKFHPLGSALVVSNGKAYIPASKIDGEQPVGISFEGSITGINEVIDNGQLTIDNSLYNLQGMKVNGNHKGVVIRSGKKYIMR